MGSLLPPAYATQEDIFFNDNPVDVIEIGGIEAYNPLFPDADYTFYIVWDELNTVDQQRLLDLVDEYGGVVPFVGPVDGFQVVDFSGNIVGGDPTGLDTTAAAPGSHTYLYKTPKAGVDATGLPTENNDGANEKTRIILSDFPAGGEYFQLSNTTTDFYVWYDVAAASEINELSFASIPANGTHFFVNDPAVDHYVWFFNEGEREATEFNFSTNTIEGGDHFTLAASGNDFYVWYNEPVNEEFTVDFSGGNGAGLVEGTYWTFSDDADDFYVWYDRPALPVEVSVDTVGVDGSTLSGGEHFLIATPSTEYYVWFTVDGAGSDPAPGGQGLLVVLNSTDTEINVSEAVEQALRNTGDFLVTDTDQTVITALAYEAGVPLAAPADVDSGITVTALEAGRDAGTDPAPGGTGIRVELDDGNSDTDAANATLLLLDDVANVELSLASDVLTVTVKASVNVTDAADVDSGLTVVVTEQGGAGSTDPAPGGTGIQVDIVGEETPAELAQLSLDAMVAGLGGDANSVELIAPTIVRVVSEAVGDQTDAADVDSGVSVVIVQPGSTNASSDPAPAGRSSIGPVQFVGGTIGGATLEEVVEEVGNVIDAVGAFTATSDGDTVTVEVTAGAVLPASDVDSGVAVLQIQAGADASTDPAPGGTGESISYDPNGDESLAELAQRTLATIDNDLADIGGTRTSNIITTTVGTQGPANAAPSAGTSPFEVTLLEAGAVATPRTFTATVFVNNVANAISVDAASAATFADLITELDADLTDATAAIDGNGNVTITADNIGEPIFIKDGDLFKNTADQLRLDTPVTSQVVNYGLTIAVDGVAQDVVVAGEDADTYTNLAAALTAAITGASAAVDADNNIAITSDTTGGDQNGTGSIKILRDGLFPNVDGFRGYKLPRNGANEFVDLLFLSKDFGGDKHFYKQAVRGIGAKPPVGNTNNTSTAVYYNGAAWVRLVDDSPI